MNSHNSEQLYFDNTKRKGSTMKTRLLVDGIYVFMLKNYLHFKSSMLKYIYLFKVLWLWGVSFAATC